MVLSHHLYYFTKFVNFKSIMNDNCIILSNFENANDYKEKYNEKSKRKKEIENYLYFSLCDDFDDNGMSLQSYRNSMLWYYYAEKCNGVCIEFDLEKLLKMQEIPECHGRIIYRQGVTGSAYRRPRHLHSGNVNQRRDDL